MSGPASAPGTPTPDLAVDLTPVADPVPQAGSNAAGGPEADGGSCAASRSDADGGSHAAGRPDVDGGSEAAAPSRLPHIPHVGAPHLPAPHMPAPHMPHLGSGASPAPRYAHVTGWGGYAPPLVLTNHDLESIVDTSDEWITSRTGIRERRIAGQGETTASIGAVAGLRAIALRITAFSIGHACFHIV